MTRSALEAELGDAAAQLADRLHRPGEVDGGERRRSGPGAAATQPATSSLEISGPAGPCQALSRPKSTPAASIAATVTSIGGGAVGDPPPVQRRSDSNMSWARKRSGRVLHPHVDDHVG